MRKLFLNASRTTHARTPHQGLTSTYVAEPGYSRGRRPPTRHLPWYMRLMRRVGRFFRRAIFRIALVVLLVMWLIKTLVNPDFLPIPLATYGTEGEAMITQYASDAPPRPSVIREFRDPTPSPSSSSIPAVEVASMSSPLGEQIDFGNRQTPEGGWDHQRALEADFVASHEALSDYEYGRSVLAVWEHINGSIEVPTNHTLTIEGGNAESLYLLQEAEDHVEDLRAFEEKVREIAQRLNVAPEWLMAVMYIESKFDPSIQNLQGSGATGLIQFMAPTVKDLNQRLGTKYYMSDIQAMPAEQQLDLVYEYLRGVKEKKGEFRSLTDLYLGVLYPSAIGKGADHVLFAKPSRAYQQNRGLDHDKDGKITVGDIDRLLGRLFPSAHGIHSKEGPSFVNRTRMEQLTWEMTNFLDRVKPLLVPGGILSAQSSNSTTTSNGPEIEVEPMWQPSRGTGSAGKSGQPSFIREQ